METDTIEKFYGNVYVTVGNICEVRGGHLRSGYSQSCGCLQKETREKYNNLRHIHKTNSLTKSGVLNKKV